MTETDDLSALSTETVNPATLDLDKLSTLELVRVLMPRTPA